MAPSAPRALLVALLVLPTVGWAGRKFTVTPWGDLCSGVCEFRLCVTAGGGPTLRPCEDLLPADPAIVIRTTGYPPLRVRLRGVTARLFCYHPGAPCDPTPNCDADDDCAPGLSCRLNFMPVCALATTCPGPGYPPTIVASGETFTVVAVSDPCSSLCEFRLCLVDEALVPCTLDAVPDVTVRAPFLVAQGRSTSRRLPFVLKYGDRQHLTLKCQPVGAPCLGCNAADDCFTGGACVDGRCRTTALCQAITTSTVTTTCPTTTSLGAPACAMSDRCGGGVCSGGQVCRTDQLGFCTCGCPDGQTCEPFPVPVGCPPTGTCVCE